MIINYPAVSRLAWLDSANFDKEGFLFVRERREGLFNHWKSETFIERLCRLRGNLLFILATSNPDTKKTSYPSGNKVTSRDNNHTSNTIINSSEGGIDEPHHHNYQQRINHSSSSEAVGKDLSSTGENRIVFILFLEECVIKLSEESNNKHFSFIIEFGKNDPTKPFHFTTISQQERDSWVECIHLSSLNYLKSLRKTFINLKISTGLASASQDPILDPIGNNSVSTTNTSSTSSSSPNKAFFCTNSYMKINLSCTVILFDDHPLEPNIFIAVFYRKEKFSSWTFLDKTEVVSSQSAKFAKQFNLPSEDWSQYQLRFKVYDVVERLTDTRVLLGESIYAPASLIMGLAENQDNSQVFDLDITSTLRDSQVIGKLKVTIKGPVYPDDKWSTNQTDSISSRRPKSLPLTSVSSSKPMAFTPSSSSSSAKIGVTPSLLEEAPEMESEKEVQLEKQECNNTDFSTGKNSISTSELPRRYSVPNNFDIQISPITNNTVLMSLPGYWNLDDDLFVNVIHRSFQFDVPLKGLSISIEEIMAESKYCMLFPQIIMNIFMDDEKKLMNCVTYSLGEVKPDYQRTQMRVLESHLRLVNVVTESINELYQVQLDKKFFRPSIAKKELFFQYVPLNFHLQRCLVSDSDGVNKRRSTICCENSSPIGMLNENNLKNSLDVYSVGVFAAHYFRCDQDNLNINTLNPHINIKNIPSSTSSSTSVATNQNSGTNKDSGSSSVTKVWKAMKNFLHISSLVQLIEVSMRKLMFYIEDGSLAQEKLKTLYEMIDSNAHKLINILNPREVEETLMALEVLKNHSSNSGHSNTMSGSINQSFGGKITTADCSTNDIRASNEPVFRKNSQSVSEEQQELEPVDLIYLNIKASLISISGKINNTQSIKCSRSEVEPSKRKLISANAALLRISSICYAIEAIKLERENLELFYNLRLKRGMIFSQILTVLITAVVNQIKSTSFQRNLVKTKSIFVYFQSLLSCYAQEIGMLNDMAAATSELNQCTTFVFINFKDSSRSTLDLPRIEGNGHNVRVIISLTSQILPDYLEAQPKAFLFNIGINEQATLAETLGLVKLQETINQSAFHRLEEYIIEFKENPNLVDLLTALKIELWSRRAKNVRILHLMEQITYHLDGIRFTSCKSAKDRTSMAITLEEVRFCSRKYNFNEIDDSHLFQQMLDTLRSEGTRRENTRKNIGIAKYAFNSLKAMTLPKLYRPPPGTYSNVRD